ncbi:hypothetical protein Pmani_012173 [Petrolisthes manimaculis]|uniref:Secreted protein n=1 Tax=Petrolisthes manimaculis TaxID=1843537 RepID=A0AAE1PZP2_9EUCA|nr:hypothetical protein Pmani_012173 [Petrolisthes manimaculis]
MVVELWAAIYLVGAITSACVEQKVLNEMPNRGERQLQTQDGNWATRGPCSVIRANTGTSRGSHAPCWEEGRGGFAG